MLNKFKYLNTLHLLTIESSIGQKNCLLWLIFLSLPDLSNFFIVKKTNLRELNLLNRFILIKNHFYEY